MYLPNNVFSQGTKQNMGPNNVLLPGTKPSVWRLLNTFWFRWNDESNVSFTLIAIPIAHSQLLDVKSTTKKNKKTSKLHMAPFSYDVVTCPA